MRTTKTLIPHVPQQMPSLIWVFAGRIGHFVDFVVLWLNSEIDDEGQCLSKTYFCRRHIVQTLLSFHRLLYRLIRATGLPEMKERIPDLNAIYAPINVFPRGGGCGGDTLGIRQTKQSLPPGIWQTTLGKTLIDALRWNILKSRNWNFSENHFLSSPTYYDFPTFCENTWPESCDFTAV